MLLAEGEGGVRLAVHRRPVRGGSRHGRDTDRERPRLGGRLVPATVVDAALEHGRKDAAHREVGAVGVDTWHQDGELITADPEDLVAPTEARGE